MSLVEIVEIYGLRIDRKEAALLEIVMEHNEYEFRSRAMKQLEQQGSPEVLKYIALHHKEYEFRNRAMTALERFRMLSEHAKKEASTAAKGALSLTDSAEQKPKEESMSKQQVISILFLSSDPTDVSRLRLGEEFREIYEQIALSKYRERLKLTLPQLALRPKDIARIMLSTQPQIVHFSGHGTPEGALCFEDESGKSHPVQPEALATLFKQFAGQVKCVVLNACYAVNQAAAIAKHIDYVIGMKQDISDKAAIAFSVGFYLALGEGKPIEEAFEFGRIQIMLQGIPEHLVPILIKKGQMQP